MQSFRSILRSLRSVNFLHSMPVISTILRSLALFCASFAVFKSPLRLCAPCNCMYSLRSQFHHSLLCAPFCFMRSFPILCTSHRYIFEDIKASCLIYKCARAKASLREAFIRIWKLALKQIDSLHLKLLSRSIFSSFQLNRGTRYVRAWYAMHPFTIFSFCAPPSRRTTQAVRGPTQQQMAIVLQICNLCQNFFHARWKIIHNGCVLPLWSWAVIYLPWFFKCNGFIKQHKTIYF